MSETSTATPNAMPGATPAEPVETAEPQEVTSTDTDQPTGNLSSEERTELARLRDIHQDEQKWRRVATKNATDAKRLQTLIEQIGGDSKESEFDPQAEFQRLRAEVATERTERTRESVARTEGVDIEDVHGDTEEAMRESAQRLKAKVEAQVEAAVQKALKGRPSSAAPAGDVTSNGKVAGPNQITSRDELKKMSASEIVAAQKEGRLDHLMGKN